MVPPTDKERLTALETERPWIKESLGRIELGQKELWKSHEKHLSRHRGNGNGNGNSGVTIYISKKALGALTIPPLTAVIGGVLGYLKFVGVIG